MDPAHKRQTAPQRSLDERFAEVRSYTEKLCAPLEIEDFIPQPIEDVSPAKWNIAHTTWFFEEMILSKFVDGYRRFDDAYAYLFNSYYNSVGTRTRRDHRGDLSRPTVKNVFEYRHYVDEQMQKLLVSDHAAEVEELTVLGINHEQQHQELLLTDLKYTLSLNPLAPVYDAAFTGESQPAAGEAGVAKLPAGLVEIGFEGDGFCFDNELSRHKTYVQETTFDKRLITNAEWIEFIDDGGYSDFRLWHSEGWDWVNANSITAPLYWELGADAPVSFTLAGRRPIVREAPVAHISYYEAAAFAEWRGARLPTEFEWEAANTMFSHGERWEWTNSAYLPYPGFQKGPGAVGEYNGKFMINQMVLRGASIVTPEGHSRPTYRNFFHPHLRWQFTGLRLAR